MIEVDWHGSGAVVRYWSLNTEGQLVLEWLFTGTDPGPPDPMTDTQKAVLRQTIDLLTRLGEELDV